MKRDLIEEAMMVALRRLDEFVDLEGWDQTPSLWGVYRNLGSGTVMFEFELLLQDAFACERPSDVLAGLADVAATRRLPLMESEVFGLAFVSEAWMVKASDGIDLDETRPAEHPSRREVRVVAAVDLAGFRYMQTRERDTLEREQRSFHRRDSAGIEEGGGYVLDSLNRLLRAVL